jgi:hypothetical protein
MPRGYQLLAHHTALLHRNDPRMARAALGHEETKTDTTSSASSRSLVTARPDVRGGWPAARTNAVHAGSQGLARAPELVPCICLLA